MHGEQLPDPGERKDEEEESNIEEGEEDAPERVTSAVFTAVAALTDALCCATLTDGLCFITLKRLQTKSLRQGCSFLCGIIVHIEF